MMKPFYPHDCEGCQYIASSLGPRTTDLTDWYVCGWEGDGGTVLGRQGEELPDYWSMPIRIVDSPRYDIPGGLHFDALPEGSEAFSETLIVARYMLQRARRLGLIPQPKENT